MEIILQLVFIVLIADFIAGTIHWLYDGYFNPNWNNFLGKVAASSIQHHKTPSGIQSATFIERNIEGGTIGLVLALILVFFSWQLALIVLLAGLGNEFHYWAHLPRKKVIQPIRFLQDIHVLQNLQHHGEHHKRPYGSFFCPITPWVNNILEHIKFWRCVERLLAHVGIHPVRGTKTREGY